MEPLIDFLLQWAFAPAVAVIASVIYWLKSNGIVDFGKFQWVLAVVFGLLFGIAQKIFLPIIGVVPIQSEWPKALLMGLATGLMAILSHTIVKNSAQGIKNHKR